MPILLQKGHKRAMNTLKSSLHDLRDLFERSITVRDIAESLTSFDADHSTHEVRNFMKEKGYDVVGVREGGIIQGYVKQDDLSNDKISDHIIQIKPDEPLQETMSLVHAFKELRDRRWVFVSILGQVGGIVTRGDLQKAPVRMWLFGLVSLIEMQLLWCIRQSYPNESWVGLLPENRHKKAQGILTDRRNKNTEIDLADCLEFVDKNKLLLKTEFIWKQMPFSSKKEVERFFRRLADLRNLLAHSQDIIGSNWPQNADIALQAEEVLEKLENIEIEPSNH